MAKYKTIFKSKEEIYGVLSRGREGVMYKGTLTVKDGGKTPVSLKMTFVPPHPFVFEMPEKHSIKAEYITDAYYYSASLAQESHLLVPITPYKCTIYKEYRHGY